MSTRISIKSKKQSLRDKIKQQFISKIKDEKIMQHNKNREKRFIKKEWDKYIQQMETEMKKYVEENPITDEDIDEFYKELDNELLEEELKLQEEEINYYADLSLKLNEEDNYSISSTDDDDIIKMMDSLNL